MTEPPFLLAYLGPDTFLPLTSVLAAAVGVVMMFGRTSLRFLSKCKRIFVRK